jgi:hypothetical protein
MPVTRIEFGGRKPGSPFEMEYPASVGMRSGDQVDALILNGLRHGGTGGINPVIMTLDDDDYWGSFTVRSGDGIDRLELSSVKGIKLAGGGLGGGRQAIDGVRILRMGGMSGDLLNNLYIEYVANYSPSIVVEPAAFAALDIRPGEVSVVTYREQSSQITEAYDQLTTHVQELSIDASAAGEYFAKFSVATGLKTTTTDTEEIKRSTEEALKTATTVTDTIAGNQVGVLICAIRVLRDNNGHHWVYPTAAANWTKLTAAQFPSLIGYYDFTSGLPAQLGLRNQNLNGLRVITA